MRRVSYIYSAELERAASQLPSNVYRSKVVHGLVRSLELLAEAASDDESLEGERENTAALRCTIIEPIPATARELEAFHTRAFVARLLGSEEAQEVLSEDSEDGLGSSEEEDERSRKRRKVDTFGLEDDCPSFPELSEYVSLVSGASLTAARALRRGEADVAINWDGGRHHAMRSRAAGFCYVNDAVLAIIDLRKSFRRVMYIDVDLHAGDGVQSAFSTSSVLTLSIHHASPGFFPPSPTYPTPSSSPSHTLSIPLSRGTSSRTIQRVWSEAVEPLRDAFQPDAVVLLCGVDGLAGDPCGVWSWQLGGEGGIGAVVESVLAWGCKTLLLGGGGYHHANAARAWAYLTSVALGRPLPLDTHIPPEFEHFADLTPSFELDVPGGQREDENASDYLDEVQGIMAEHAAKLRDGRKPRK